ncbi:EI24 domain-containing protein [Leptolyngbya sp. GB1-A1]|uniref:EI24 domain-containing protein n=1 Tax=Leptolyngbya sp. GB1-A1 TaxID=2933908 RepID=UPI0032976A3C
MTQQPNSQPISAVPPIDRGPGSMITGASYPLRAVWLFAKLPQLRKFILIPIVINLVLGVTLYAALLSAGYWAIDALIAGIPGWLAQLSQVGGSIAQVDLPSVHLPPIQLPDLTAYLPHIPLPQIALPAIQLPDWRLPQWQFPQWQFPQWQINLPAVRLPDWLLQWLNAVPGETLRLFVFLLRGLLTVILLLLTGFVLLQFGVLLGAPWYGKLSEEIEILKTGQLRTVNVSFLTEIGRAITYELNKLILTIVFGLPLFLLNFFPGIGTVIATIGGIILADTIVCLDFLDSAVERRRPSFRQKLGIVGRSLPGSAGFAIVCLVLVSIPFVNLLAIPVCVAAGTLFFCDRILPWYRSEKTEERKLSAEG